MNIKNNSTHQNSSLPICFTTWCMLEVTEIYCIWTEWKMTNCMLPVPQLVTRNWLWWK